MIVRPANGALLLIRQPDHAALARRIMLQWTALQGAERRESILRAIGEHDNGWVEPDSAPIIDPTTGRILDFVNLPPDQRQEVWPRAVGRLAEDAWAAALVAQHALFVYDRFRTSPQWQGFFAEMEGLRQSWLQRVHGLTLDELLSDYAFVRLGDLASLAFCNAWTDEQRYAGCVIRLYGTRLVVSPDPFGGREIDISVPARELPDRRFTGDADAAEVYASAPRRVLSGTVAGAPPPDDSSRTPHSP